MNSRTGPDAAEMKEEKGKRHLLVASISLFLARLILNLEAAWDDSRCNRNR